MTYAGALDVNIYIKRNFASLDERVLAISPEGKILCLVNGGFSERFAVVAESFAAVAHTWLTPGNSRLRCGLGRSRTAPGPSDWAAPFEK